ncbi:MAG: hypothetical protein WKF31_00005 [Thermoleophilaceae bacterium]
MPDEGGVHDHLEDLLDVWDLRPPERLPLAHVVGEQGGAKSGLARLAHALDHRRVRVQVLEVDLAEAVERDPGAEVGLEAAEELALGDPARLELEQRVGPAVFLGGPLDGRAGDPRTGIPDRSW